ncbi:hypothetical protein Q7C30_004270 [Pseudomonas sp. RAC1]|uniref:hypothetical protein n=1 Tax=Pseudomonas sp. RAC1 TaxID=3064900 RepID=UPI00271B9193|nr:hypothetical protein [Pseudomonas sp. RAC1]MDV9031321.1 hypothetical protein [Pseudomonas sp. RAC1]
MPTENRSTLRDLFIRLNPSGLDSSELVTDSLSFAEPATALEFQLFSAGYEAAQQHQGEPVVLPARKNPSAYPLPMDAARGYGWNACLDEIAKLGPLYTRPAPAGRGDPVAWRYKTRVYVQALGHVWREVIETEAPNQKEVGVRDLTPLFTHGDPAEVERLREQANSWAAKWEEAIKAGANLERKLAEAHALLQNAKYVVEQARAIDKQAFAKGTQNVEHRLYRGLGALLEQYDSALSASAEPGEIERLRAELSGITTDRDRLREGLDNANINISNWDKANQKLKAELAERDALLREWRHGKNMTLRQCASLNERTDSALRERAEPSAPVEIDERAEFEAHYLVDHVFESADFEMDGDRYVWQATQDRWEAWQARAALERKPQVKP